MKTHLVLTTSVTLAALALTQACTVTTVQSGPDGGVADGGIIATDGGSGCSFGEPNNTRETAFPIAAGSSYAGICLEKGNGGDDTDFYSFTSPASDKAGGYVTVNITNVQVSDVVIKAYDAVTNEIMEGDFHALSGASLKVWFAVRPGRKYNILVEHYVRDVDGTYDMALAYTKVEDAYEANNTRELASPITLGANIEGTFVKTQGVGVENDQVDWYKFEVANAPATVSASISNVATDADCQIKIYDSAFAEVGNGYANKGESFTAVAKSADLKTGTYYLKLDTWVNSVSIMGEGEPADHLVRKYKLTTAVTP
jgi:hypothetical protein